MVPVGKGGRKGQQGGGLSTSSAFHKRIHGAGFKKHSSWALHRTWKRVMKQTGRQLCAWALQVCTLRTGSTNHLGHRSKECCVLCPVCTPRGQNEDEDSRTSSICCTCVSVTTRKKSSVWVRTGLLKCQMNLQNQEKRVSILGGHRGCRHTHSLHLEGEARAQREGQG